MKELGPKESLRMQNREQANEGIQICSAKTAGMGSSTQEEEGKFYLCEDEKGG